MLMPYAEEKKVAIAAVVSAAKLCEQVRQSHFLASMDKADRTPITIADFGAQAVICRAIAGSFPADAIVAEEDTALLKQPEMRQRFVEVTNLVKTFIPSATEDAVAAWIERGNGSVGSRFWTLDPIDGTKGFLRGDQYAIAIALIEAGEVKLGILACPALAIESIGGAGVIFAAVRGQGTQVMPLDCSNSKPVQVLTANDHAYFRLAESVESGHGDPERQRAVAKAINLTMPSLRMDSQAKYGAIACGQAALYLRLPWVQVANYQENIWDHAAGAIVVEEAGGRVTDMEGRPLDFATGSKLINNRGIVVSNGTLHEAVLAVLRQKT